MPGVFGVTVQAGPVLVPLLVGVVVVWLLALGHRRALTAARAVTVVAASTYAAAVLALTFFPMTIVVGPGANHAPWWTQVNVVPGVGLDPRNFVLNVAMTLPLGALLPLLTRVRSVAAAGLAGLGVSAAIEGLQWAGSVVLSMTRTADVDDLIANVAGTVLGLLAYRVAASVAAGTLGRFALPGAAADPGGSEVGPGWLVDEPDGPDETAVVGARTAITAAASSAVPKR